MAQVGHQSDEVKARGVHFLSSDMRNYITGTNLSGGNFIEVKAIDGYLAQAASLEGATLPDGTVHE